MKFICVLIAIAFIACADAVAPENLCDQIQCYENESSAKVCANDGSFYKVFDNNCEMRKFNCNKGKRFEAVDVNACRIISELGMGFMFM